MITDANNNAVWRWDNSEPFGNNPPNENPSGLGIFVNNRGFPGQYRDKETNTFYNGFRDCYDPSTGRYCQFDPIGLRGGLNGFAYALSNPLRYVDSSGLISTIDATKLIFQELKKSFPETYGKLDPSFTVIPWLRGQGTTVGNWVNINPVAYGFELDHADLFQLTITVAHESQHTAQSIGTQIEMKRLTDDNYDPNNPHWKIEDKAESNALKIFQKVKKACENK